RVTRSSIKVLDDRSSLAPRAPMIRGSRNALAVATMTLTACATAHQPQTVWQNPTNPQRNYIGDSQECDLIATALVKGNLSGVSPIYRLAFQNVQWNRCMVGRNWQQVSVSAVSTPPPSPILVTRRAIDDRWKRISETKGRWAYLDTANVIREPNGTLRVWVMTQFDTALVVNSLRIQRFMVREDFDCEQRRTRTLSIAVEDPSGAQQSQAVPSPVFHDVAPESSDE